MNEDSRQIEHTGSLYVYRCAAYKSSRPINKAFERERSLQHVRDDRRFALFASNLRKRQEDEGGVTRTRMARPETTGTRLKVLTAEFNAKLIKPLLAISREEADNFALIATSRLLVCLSFQERPHMSPSNSSRFRLNVLFVEPIQIMHTD